MPIRTRRTSIRATMPIRRPRPLPRRSPATCSRRRTSSARSLPWAPASRPSLGQGHCRCRSDHHPDQHQYPDPDHRPHLQRAPAFTSPGATVEGNLEGGAELEGEVEISQEQEDIEQENEAEQTGLEYPIYAADGVTIIGWENGPALAEAEAISGAVSVVQPVTSTLIAGAIDPVTLQPIGDGIDAASVAEADAELAQQAVQDNINRQEATTALRFTAAPTFGNTGTVTVGGDVDIDAGIEEIEVELEQEQEDIDQSNEAEQDAVADADAGYEGFGYAVSVVQDGTLAAADTGIDAEASADADAELSQLADQGNENAQTATPTVAFTAAPRFRPHPYF